MEILNLLHSHRWISDTSFTHVQTYVRQWNCDAYDALLETNLFTQSDLAEVLAQSLRIERVTKLSCQDISSEMLSYFPYRLAFQLSCFPVALDLDAEELKVAFCNPLDMEGIDKVRTVTKMKIVPMVAERAEICKAIGKHYPISEQIHLHDV